MPTVQAYSIAFLDVIGELDLFYKFKLWEDMITCFKNESRSENSSDIVSWDKVLDTIFSPNATGLTARSCLNELDNNVPNAEFLSRLGRFLKKFRTNKKNWIGDAKDKKITSLLNEIIEKDKIIETLKSRIAN